MSVTKDGDTGRWMSQIRVTDWTGKTIHKKKRGFTTKKEALQWERDFISQSTGSLGMTFGDFITLYVKDMEQSQRSKLLSEIPPVDIVITMGCNVTCPSLPCRYREDWGLDDPTGKDDDCFLEAICSIEKKVFELKNRVGSGLL